MANKVIRMRTIEELKDIASVIDPLPVLNDNEVFMLSIIQNTLGYHLLDLCRDSDWSLADFTSALSTLATHGIIKQSNGTLSIRR